MKIVRPVCSPAEHKIFKQVVKALRKGVGIQLVDAKGKPIGKPYYVEPSVSLEIAA